MEQQIRSTAQQIQRIIRSALNNIRTGLIKRIMSLFKVFAALGKKLNPLDFFLGQQHKKHLKKFLIFYFAYLILYLEIYLGS